MLIWEKIADEFKVSVQEVMARWIKVICPKLKNNAKIGGAYKWSISEDHVLYAADKARI